MSELTSNFWVLWLLIAATASISTQDINFVLVNSTAYPIATLWLAKHGGPVVWHGDLINRPLKPGEKVSVHLTNSENWRLWDLRIRYSRHHDEVFSELELPAMAQVEIQLLPDGKWNAHYLLKKP